MKTTFLEYYKVILEKVSFDQSIFKREYHKARGILKQEELKKLNKWLSKNGLVEYVEV